MLHSLQLQEKAPLDQICSQWHGRVKQFFEDGCSTPDPQHVLIPDGHL
jgi:hypothetical protein